MTGTYNLASLILSFSITYVALVREFIAGLARLPPCAGTAACVISS